MNSSAIVTCCDDIIQRLREKGFTRRQTWRSLPKDGDAETELMAGIMRILNTHLKMSFVGSGR